MGRGGSVHLSPISFLPKYVLTEFTGFPRLFPKFVELGPRGAGGGGYNHSGDCA